MRPLSHLPRNSTTGWPFALLLAAFVTHIWFSSTPGPFGGPNVLLAGAVVLLAVLSVALQAFRLNTEGGQPFSAGIVALARDFRPVIPVLAVSALLILWMLAVYLFTDTLDKTHMAQTLLGTGVLLAVYLFVDRLHRAKLMALVVMAAILVSVLWGMAVAFMSNSFLNAWLQIATVRAKDLNHIFLDGRISGFVPYAGVFAYQLAVAIPLAFAALLYRPFGENKTTRRAFDAVLFVTMMAMITALILNATRAAILSVLVSGVAIVIVLSLSAPHFRRRLLFIVPLTAVWLLAFFNPVFTVSDVPGIVSGLFDGSHSPVPEFLPGSERASVAVGESMPVGIQSLADMDGHPAAGHIPVGIQSLADMDGHPAAGHIVEGLTPSVGFTAQVRLFGEPGREDSETIVATTDDSGSLALVWREPEGHSSIDRRYRFRLRRDGEANWGPWLSICFPADCSYWSSKGPHIRGLAAAVNGSPAAGHTITGLAPGEEYQAQIRARNEYGYGPQSGITGAANDDGALSLAWREPDNSASITAWQLRLRPAGEARWSPWRDFDPLAASVYGAPPPRIGRLEVGFHTLRGRSDEPRIGYVISLAGPGRLYEVQLRTRNANAFGPESEIFAVSEDGNGIVLSWPDPDGPESITAYQFRLRRVTEAEWRPWRGLVPTLSNSGNPGAMRGKVEGSRNRIFTYSGWSAQLRMYMAPTALRYSLNYPLGTGTYRPGESHVAWNPHRELVPYILDLPPHNQFLYVMVLFGFPGLILIVLFYMLVLRSLVSSARYILPSRDASLHFILVGVSGALFSYSIVSLLHPEGPFIVDWSHFFIIGLVFSIQKIAAARMDSGNSGELADRAVVRGLGRCGRAGRPGLDEDAAARCAERVTDRARRNELTV